MCIRADVQMKSIIRILFGFTLVLTSLSVCGQFSNKLPSIKLSTHPPNNCVIYVMDSVQFYFDKKAVIKVLQTASLYHDKADTTLIKELQKHVKDSFTIKANSLVYNPKTGYYNETDAEWALSRNMIYLLFGGTNFSVYETKKRSFVNRMYIEFYDFDMDIKGPYIGYSIYAPDGWLIQKSRAYNEKLDFLMEKKFF